MVSTACGHTWATGAGIGIVRDGVASGVGVAATGGSPLNVARTATLLLRRAPRPPP
ncbi:hypothetical protein ACFQGX_40935 [Nonomuraea dietziae]|uniref:hypothetical protein n=1 Tax=Nonomuraea dietziae TaxID=65515 RepID=UPI00361651EF